MARKKENFEEKKVLLRKQLLVRTLDLLDYVCANIMNMKWSEQTTRMNMLALAFAVRDIFAFSQSMSQKKKKMKNEKGICLFIFCE